MVFAFHVSYNMSLLAPYSRYVLDQSTSIDEMGAPRWQLVLCLMLAWTVVFIVLIRGIKSLGKVSAL